MISLNNKMTIKVLLEKNKIKIDNYEFQFEIPINYFEIYNNNVFIILNDNSIYYYFNKSINFLNIGKIASKNKFTFFDNNVIFNLDNGSFRIFNIENNTLIDDFSHNFQFPYDKFLISPNKKWLASINNQYGQLFVWSLEEKLRIYCCFQTFQLNELKWIVKRGKQILVSNRELFESQYPDYN